MLSGSREPAPIGVDRLQPGDHACLVFSDDGERWEVLSDFARHGFARGEKVYLNVDTAGGLDDVAALAAGGAAAARTALDSGQLVVSHALRFSPGDFDAGLLASQSIQRLDAAAAEGFSGVRAANELSVTADGLEEVVEFEKALHQVLATPGDGPRYTALCHWDEHGHWDERHRPGEGSHQDERRHPGKDGRPGERQLGASLDMDAVRALHPVSVISRPGTLHVRWMTDGIRLTGDSDLSTRDEFTEAINTLGELPTPAESPEQPLVLDISDLSFLDAHSAGTILRMAAGLPRHRRLEVRCRAHHRRLLHMLGARALRQLSIVTSRLA
ncbi:MAG: MEDS domain-containing protein [Trebonia sp.]